MDRSVHDSPQVEQLVRDLGVRIVNAFVPPHTAWLPEAESASKLSPLVRFLVGSVINSQLGNGKLSKPICEMGLASVSFSSSNREVGNASQDCSHCAAGSTGPTRPRS
jgi:hypothetical protein